MDLCRFCFGMRRPRRYVCVNKGAFQVRVGLKLRNIRSQKESLYLRLWSESSCDDNDLSLELCDRRRGSLSTSQRELVRRFRTHIFAAKIHIFLTKAAVD